MTGPAPAQAGQPPPARPTLFVSDVHLDAGAPDSERHFLQFLRTEAATAGTLYILGDLFETWVGDDAGDSEPVLAGLAGLTGAGVACFLLHGNRDFLIGRRFCERTGCRLLPDPVIVDLGGERVLLTHGDALCTGDHAYQELRTVVRQEAWQRRFLRLPLTARRLLASEARAGSRAHTARTVPTIMDVDDGTVEQAVRATGARRIIHGHTHRPAVHPSRVDGRPVERIVLGAWYEQGSCLVYQDGRYELRVLPRPPSGA